jgi:hypothetical protein
MIHSLCALIAFAAVAPAGDAGTKSTGDGARPVSLAADDFDGDGVRDLACGYAAGGSGFVTISRGDAAAVYGPGSLAADAAPPFSAPVRVAALPAAPDLLAAGDFDNDGRRDVVAGALGGEALYLLAGDGRGGLVAPGARALPGKRTALGSGDVNRIDGLADLVAGVTGAAGPRLLVFEGPDGAVRATPEVVPVTAPVAAVAVGQFDGDAPVDVAAAAGSDLVVVHGRNRPLVAGEEGAKLAPPPAVDVRAGGASGFEALTKRASHAVSLAGRTVLASVPMRLNADAIDDYAVLEPGRGAPSFVLSQPETTFVVTTTADDGLGSLRVAIGLANASPGADAIRFAIPGSGVHTIQPVTALPEIVDPVTIDATTQPGYAGMPLVEIDGSLVAEEPSVGLHVFAGSSVVRGLAINRFAQVGDDDGSGIVLEEGGGNIVEGNFLGVDTSGVADRGNGNYNVHIYESADNLIGGRTAEARNVVSGSCGLVCIAIEYDEAASGNRVEGNYIGTDVTGTVDLNSAGGVFLGGGPNCVVGGTAPGARNVISGNGGDFVGGGVGLQGVRNNLVQGNYIGTDPTGTSPVNTGQATAVLIDGQAMDNTIGGTAAGAANRIAFDTYGVDVGEYLADSTGNAILCNEIFGHDDIGIGLGYDEVTPNDRGDTDGGSNNLQNFPVLTSASRSGDTIAVEGRLSGTPNATFRVEFFANTACNRFGFGEGETFLGFRNVTTDASGIATFSATLTTDAGTAMSVTATATDADGNTSEFSMCVELMLSWQPPDDGSSEQLPPPRNLTAEVVTVGVPPGSASRDLLAGSGGGVTAYNVYRSTQPGVQPSAATFFTSVPATTTSATGSVFVGGTFFVVTAVYPNGESGPSNEVVTGVPPTIASVKAGGAKVTGKGSGFTTDSVLVTVDGIPFRSPAVVKGGGAKVVQRGVLITGETVLDYARTRPGGVVTVLFRNSDGGVDGSRVKVPGT